jgi:uncharacterized protein (DUF1778 family)
MPSAQDNGHLRPRSRQTRIQVRLTALQMVDIQRAAALRGQTVSEFLLASATDVARQIVSEHTSIELTQQEQVVFVQALLDPQSAAPRLHRAVETYRKAATRRAGRDVLG